MRLKFKREIVKDDHIDVPDEYSDDTTLRGRMVDALLTQEHFKPEDVRENLFDENPVTIENAVATLNRAYGIVDALLPLALPEEPGNKALIIFHEKAWPSTTLCEDAQMDPLRRGYAAMREEMLGPKW